MNMCPHHLVETSDPRSLSNPLLQLFSPSHSDPACHRPRPRSAVHPAPRGSAHKRCPGPPRPRLLAYLSRPSAPASWHSRGPSACLSAPLTLSDLYFFVPLALPRPAAPPLPQAPPPTLTDRVPPSPPPGRGSGGCASCAVCSASPRAAAPRRVVRSSR